MSMNHYGIYSYVTVFRVGNLSQEVTSVFLETGYIAAQCDYPCTEFRLFLLSPAYNLPIEVARFNLCNASENCSVKKTCPLFEGEAD